MDRISFNKRTRPNSLAGPVSIVEFMLGADVRRASREFSSCYAIDEERVVVVRWGLVSVRSKRLKLLKFPISRWFHSRVATAIVDTRV